MYTLANGKANIYEKISDRERKPTRFELFANVSLVVSLTYYDRTWSTFIGLKSHRRVASFQYKLKDKGMEAGGHL